ncbi:MAG: T9SS type A sorting domain-containing protein [Bacteroidota bacterium]|nr:T9SS type A sorting domain-containing protein [Bacteroidota bacterium]
MHSQTVSKLAGQQYVGNGKYNDLRDKLKDSVWFSAPMGIEIDTSGRIYVSNEHNIFWISGNTCYLAAGTMLDPLESGSADSKDFAGIVSRFARPAGLSINSNTNEMFVADLDNNQIRTVEKFINIATQQAVTTFSGVRIFSNPLHLDGAKATARFNAPAGIAVASNGDVYIADRANHCIRKISGGTVSTIAGSPGNSGKVNGIGSVARFTAPYNVFIDGNNLLVCDFGNTAIRKINLSNNEVTDLITTGLSGPRDICRVGSALMIAEELCIKKYENNVLSVYVGNANVSGYVNAVGTSARFNDITSLVYDERKKLIYAVDMGNNVIRSISLDLKPVSNFTASSTAATKGQTIILRSTSNNMPTSFKWSITPSNTYTLLNNSKLTDSLIYISFSQAGAYTVKLWVANTSGADSLQKNNHIAVSSVTAAPVADFSASKLMPTINEVIDLIDLSTNSPASFKWRIQPATFEWAFATDSTSQFPKVKFLNIGKYQITLIATNDQGSNSLTKVDFINVQLTSVNSFLSQSTLIYPNPCFNELNLKLKDNQSNVVIKNHFGLKLIELNSEENILKVDVSSFQNGLYFIEINNSFGTEIIKFNILR